MQPMLPARNPQGPERIFSDQGNRHVFRIYALALAAIACASSPSMAQTSTLKTDLVFVVDCSQSMSGNIAAVRDGVNAFAQQLVANNIDARFALVRYGRALPAPAVDGRPELVLDLTPNAAELSAALAALTVGGTVEPGLEAVRMALGAAPQGFEQAPGSISYRSGALTNIILLTDEDSDSPRYDANRMCVPNGSGGTLCQGNGSPSGPGSTTWPAYQAEIDATAAALLARGAYLNLVINSTNGQALFQYGTPYATVLDANGNYDRMGTFNAMSPLVQQSVQGRVLGGGGLARSFDIGNIPADLDNDGISDLVEDLFRTKVQETLQANAAPVFTPPAAGQCATGGTPLSATVGSTLQIPVQVAAPEANQVVTLQLGTGTPANVVLNYQPAASFTAMLSFTPTAGQTGLQTIRLVATDNGLPQASSILELCVQVGMPAISTYCFGTGCPCGNDDAGAGCANSTGNGGLLMASGSAQIANDDLMLVASNLPAGSFGIVYAGTSTTRVPFGDGFLCVLPGPPGSPAGTGFLRLPIRMTGATGGFQEGPGIIGWTATQTGSLGPIAPGTQWHFQAYYRNPRGPCGSGWNLTNAVSVTFQ